MRSVCFCCKNAMTVAVRVLNPLVLVLPWSINGTFRLNIGISGTTSVSSAAVALQPETGKPFANFERSIVPPTPGESRVSSVHRPRKLQR
jgi:hypothetical protein